MTRRGVVLYGPPASGKDTITQELCRLEPQCVHFQRLKVGTERTTGYRLATAEAADELVRRGFVLYENERYGNRYLVDTPHINELLVARKIPVLHIGQVCGIMAVTRYPVQWLPVLLWCPREVAEQRAKDRGSGDVAARLAAWDETAQDLAEHGTERFALRIDTDQQDPTQSAEVIANRLDRDRRSAPWTRGSSFPR